MKSAGRPQALLFVVVALACQRAPRPLVAGTDACDYCRMTVTDPRFGGELQSRTGRIHTFDAIECLASFYLDAASRDDIRAAWVTDFETGRFVPVDSAIILQEGSIASPMGRSLVAFAPESAELAVPKYGGRALRWPDVLEVLRVRRLEPGATPRDTVKAPVSGASR
ncbi:MAG TPA: nitrous oxide reductase accessory protein NosL [Gemmatimonadaceae bacterium]